MSIKVYLSQTSSPSSPRIPLTIPSGTSAAQLRTMVSEATSIPLSNLKLIFRGRMIAEKQDNNVVAEFNLEDECVIHVVGKATTASASPAAAPAAASIVSGASVTVPPASASAVPNTLNEALTTLRLNPLNVYKTSLSTASKILSNIVQFPMEEKYRSIKKSNAAFNKRLGGVTGGEALLFTAGFVLEDGVYILRPSEEAWPKLVDASEMIGQALKEAEANSAASSFPSASGFGAAAPGAGGMPPMGMPNLGSMPGMEAAMQNIMSNPAALQNMMNDPMVQQMIQSNPRLANNPMVQQSLNALQSNPNILRQFSQMMNDPGIQSNVNRMMQQSNASDSGTGANSFARGPEEMRRQMEYFEQMQQAFGGSSGSFNLQPQQQGTQQSQGSIRNNNSNNNNSSDNSSEMTEEEMIAEAIARSLRES